MSLQKPNIVVGGITGWVLIVRDEVAAKKPQHFECWHIALNRVFTTRKEALAFAGQDDWKDGYRAVPGSLSTDYGVKLR